MIIKKAQIRGTHQDNYRKGEWATIIGVDYVSLSPSSEESAAYLVRYDDGKTDYISIWNVCDYELRPAI